MPFADHKHHRFSLSQAQKSIWIHQRVHPGTNAFNIPVLFTVDSADIDAIKNAIHRVVLKHEMLSVVFGEEDGSPYQEMLQSGDGTPIEMMEADSELYESHLLHFVQQIFNISEGPLYRFAIINNSDQEYAVLMVLHHLITDGTSLFLLAGEIRSLLAGNNEAEKENANASAINNYKEFINEEQTYLASANALTDKNYLLNKLSGGVTRLTLPYDFIYDSHNRKSASRKTIIQGEAFQKLEAVAKKSNCSIYTVLYACFNILMYRLSGESNITIASPVINRNKKCFRTQGLFLNTLVLSSTILPEMTVSAFLKEAKSTLMGAIRHKAYPYGALMSELSTSAVSDGYPVANVFFNGLTFFDDFMAEEAFEAFQNGFGLDANFDLNGYVGISSESVMVRFDYRTSILKKETIDNFLLKYKEIIRIVSENTEVGISGIQYSTIRRERNTGIDASWYQPNCTITELFHRQAIGFPENIAVRWANEVITYKELDNLSNQLANLLLGTVKENRVGICLSHNHKLAIAVLGILKAGKSYVPLDPGSPVSRIEQILTGAGFSNVITDETTRCVVQHFSEQVNCISIDNLPEDDRNPGSVVKANDEAYIIFTSGSSGKVKGVIQNHQNVLHFISQYSAQLRISEADCVTGFSPLTYDSFNNDFWGAVLNGATWCPLSLAESADVDLYQWAELNKISIWHSVPGAFRLFAEEWKKCGYLCDFRIVKMTGEAVRVYDFDLFKSVTRSTALFAVSLGSAESTLSSINMFTHHDSIERSIMPVGFPIGRTDVCIMSNEGTERDVLEPGEIVVRSNHFAIKYLNDELLSNQVFKVVNGTRCYFTGDKGLFREDGRIEWIGRNDAFVKLNGIRIETSEIEFYLLKYSKQVIKEALVLVKEDGSGMQYLCCYYSSAEPVTDRILTSYLLQFFPRQLVPSVFVWVKDFPRLPHGKIDKKALPDVCPVKKSGQIKPVQNRTGELLVQIWSDILLIDSHRISIDDSFFELGGNSLKAIQLTHRIHETFNRRFPLKDIFAMATIAELVDRIDSETEDRYELIPAVPVQDHYPLSRAQERIWILSQLEGGSVAYNISAAVEIKGAFHIDSFKKSIESLINRHESLRTIFIDVNGETRQKVLSFSETGFDIELIQLTRFDHSEIKSLLGRKANIPFQLNRAPLLRVLVIPASENLHVVLLTIHHIVSDGWSMNVMVNEIILLYDSFLQKQENRPDPLRIQYKDFSYWHNQLIQSDSITAQRKYWLDQFKEEVTVLDLPANSARSTNQTFNGAQISFYLNPELSASVRRFTNDNQLTLFMTLLSLVKALLYRYTGQSDIVIGTALAGRDHLELEHQIGLYVNTLALRTRFEGNDTFTMLTEKVRETTVGGFQNGLYTFDYLVQDLKIGRDVSRNPLFDVMVVLQNSGKPYEQVTALKDCEVVRVDLDRVASQFDLSFNFEELTSAIKVNIEYNLDLFRSETIGRFRDHFLCITAALLQQPHVPLHSIHFLPEDETNKLVKEFNDHEVLFPVDKTVYHYIDRWAKNDPERIAVQAGDNLVSYGELSRVSTGLAKRLQEYGVKPGELFGVIMNRSVEMIVSILSIWKLGCSYIPLSITDPPARVNQILDDAGVSKILIKENTGDVYKCQAISVNIDEYQNGGSEIENEFDIDGLSYVIFTSGSSGKPKGVMIEHLGMMNHLYAKINDLSLNADSIVAQTASHTFDISVWQFFSALIVGGKTVIFSDNVVENADEFSQQINQYEIGILELVPSYLNVLYRICIDNKIVLKHLKVLLATGETLLPELADKWLTAYPEIKLVNAYGPTEASDDITHYFVDKAGFEKNIVPIGRPVQNTNIYIVNECGQLCPIGCKGEIWVSGPGVGKGYLNDEERTGKSFSIDPFIKHKKLRLYKTGDIGSWTTEGSILFFGRTDAQVKIRGFRIELGEIENCFKKHPAINDCVVVSNASEAKGKYLCAYYTADTNPGEKELAIFLRQNLPYYMVPQYLVKLDKLPTLSNGKIDRKSLPVSPDVVNQDFAAPVTDIEIALSMIWSDILGLEKEKISVNDNFFEAGGNSLTAMRLGHQISKQFQVQIPYKFIYNNPYIRSLQEFIQGAVKQEYIPLIKAEKKSLYKATAAQVNMYNFQVLHPDSLAYNLYAVIPLNKTAGIEKLENAILQLVDRHESLRTSFVKRDGVIYQEIAATISNPVRRVYFPALDKEEVVREVIKPFDLSQAPLLDVYVAENDEGTWLVLNTHHIICDGISVQILFKELNDLYAGFTPGEVKFQFSDYSEWYHSVRVQDIVKGQKEYWQNINAGSDIFQTDLPADFVRPKEPVFSGSRDTFVLDETWYNKIVSICNSHKTTPFSYIFSLFVILLNKITGQQELVIGCPVSGRNNADVQDIVGMFVNTLAIRTKADPYSSFNDFLNTFTALLTESLSNQDYPVSCLPGDLKWQTDKSSGSLFNVVFVYNNYRHQRLVFSENGMEPGSAIYNSSKFDLTLYCEEKEHNIYLSFVYNTALFNDTTIGKFRHYFMAILNQVSADESIDVGKISIISADDRQKILNEFNKVATSVQYRESVYKKIYNCWQTDPDKKILQFYNEELSLQELLVRVNACTEQLLKFGCKPNDIVAVSSEPSIGLVVSVLAVNRIGCCVLPVDPDQPLGRVQHILKDSGAVCLLVNDARDALNFSSFAGKILVLKDVPERQNETEFRQFTIPEHAYIVYTSGTTGAPKGVLIKNESLINYLEWFRKTTGMQATDVTILLSSFSFDLCYTAFYSALYNGQKLHLLKKSDYLNPEFLLKYFKQHVITYIKLTPSYFAWFYNYKELFSETFLRWVILGGEKIRIGDVETLMSIKPGVKFMNHYGPTETTIGTIYEIIDIGSLPEYRNKTIIGKPIENNQVFILNDHLNIIPVGLQGEICISGKGVAAGYLNAPGLTGSKFIPFGELDGRTIYRTGDIGKWLPDGRIEFIGRIDKQIKWNGYRIEINEVERAILKCSGATNAVVVPGEIDNRKVLVGYIVTADDIDIPSLKMKLRDQLPFYMVPGILIRVNSLPVTANGKLDLEKLPKPQYDHKPATNLSEMELEVVKLWAGILGLGESDIVSNEADFFELGGNSVTAIQLVNAISSNFNKAISYKDLYQNPGVRQLALLISNSDKIPMRLVKADKKVFYPAADAQKRMYIENKFSPQALDYNKIYIVRLVNHIPYETVAEIFKEIINRHIVFRTTFHLHSNDICQKVNDFSLADISAETIDKSALNQCIHFFRRPFRLDELPLIRIKYLTIRNAETLLLIETHHITSDGVSMMLLVREFMDMVNGRDIKPINFNYIDYSEWLANSYNNTLREKQRKFWEKEFNTPVSFIQLPFKRQKTEGSNFTKQVKVVVGGALNEKINEFIRMQKITHYSFFLTCYSILINKICRLDNALLGLIVDGRNLVDIKDTIGMFVNTLPYKIQVRKGKKKAELFREVNGKMLDYYEAQNYSLQNIDKDYRSKLGVGLLDKLGMYFEFNNYSLLLDDYKDRMVVDDNQFDFSRLDFIMRVSATRDSFIIQAKYAEDLYFEEDVAGFLDQYEKIIAAMPDDGDELPLSLSDVEIEEDFDFSFDF